MKKFLATGAILLLILPAIAQDLLKGLEDSVPAREKVAYAFKSTRVINAHSIEMLAKGNLDFRILHRFSRVNTGVDQWFGLDGASMRMSFDYGLSNDAMVGIGRSTYRKEIDGFVKARFLQQTTGGVHAIPFSLVIAAGSTIWTGASPTSVKPSTSDRTSYYLQLLIGRKFSDRFSFQLSPMYLRRNMVDRPTEDFSLFALGGGARFKVSNRIAFTADYHHALSGIPSANTDPLSVGVDIETGGHVFQLHFTNAVGMNERAYITETTDKFFKGDVRFGFNLSRMFNVGGKKGKGWNDKEKGAQSGRNKTDSGKKEKLAN
ncbi:MAG: hypothetical protein INR73_16295 [Williamsia sp.]|nr:hypothetical protein [Williamsia sp.]